MALGLMPAVVYLSERRNPMIASISLFAFGGAIAILAPTLGAVGNIVYWDGINPLLFVIVLLASVPATQYSGQSKEMIIMLVTLFISIIYLFIILYIISAFTRTQDALVFIPLIGVTLLVLTVVATFLNEYERAGLRRLEV